MNQKLILYKAQCMAYVICKLKFKPAGLDFRVI